MSKNIYIDNFETLYDSAKELFDSFEIEDIESDGFASVIVDTLVSDNDSTVFSKIRAINTVNGDTNTDEENLDEELESAAEQISDKLNKMLPDDEDRTFSFEWDDGGFYLTFGCEVDEEE